MGVARDLKLAYRAKRHGSRYSLRIIWEARRANIPISLAFALVEQESNFRNIFGHDRGGPFAGQNVTASKVRQLISHVHRGGTSNGVGLTQLTWIGYIEQAQRRGGAHIPKHQLSVAFDALHNLIRRYGVHGGYKHYNGTGSAADVYADRLEARQRRWHRYLTS